MPHSQGRANGLTYPTADKKQTMTSPLSSDREALVAFYNATHGPEWDDNEGWLSDEPIGEWYGVITDRNGRVVSLSLDDNNLTGELPPELGSLTRLDVLSLSLNNLSGELPSELGALICLEVLDLSLNNLSGGIPEELGNLTQLEELDLSLNNLSGEIPPELANLINLEDLFLDHNNLRGEIPPGLANLPDLERLSLGGEVLEVDMPPGFSEPGAVFGNQYTGCIPERLRDLLTEDEVDQLGLPVCGP